MAFFLAVAAHGVMAAALAEAIAYESPACGCCRSWVEHMKANGFTVSVIEQHDIDVIEQRFDVPARLASCHTALAGGNVVEGYVPASAVKRLLQEKPAALGVSAPGMPVGSRGMASPNPEPFTVQLSDERGRMGEFESYRPPYRR